MKLKLSAIVIIIGLLLVAPACTAKTVIITPAQQYTQAEVVAIARASNPGVPDDTQSRHYAAHFEASLFEGSESSFYVVTKELWIVTKEIGFVNPSGQFIITSRQGGHFLAEDETMTWFDTHQSLTAND